MNWQGFDWTGGLDHGGEPIESSWSQKQKYEGLWHPFRDIVDKVCDALRESEFSPKMVFTWRSVETQAALVAKGRSRVAFSFHNTTDEEGHPASLAVDLFDERYGFDGADALRFFAAMGAAGKLRGLVWGGDWKSFPDLGHLQMFPNSALSWVKRASLAPKAPTAST